MKILIAIGAMLMPSLVAADVSYGPYAMLMRLQQDGLINLSFDEAFSGDPFAASRSGLKAYSNKNGIDPDDAVQHMVDEAKSRSRSPTKDETGRGLAAIIRATGDGEPIGYTATQAYAGPHDTIVLCGTVSVRNQLSGPTGPRGFQVHLSKDGDTITPDNLEPEWACLLGTSLFVFAKPEDLNN